METFDISNYEILSVVISGVIIPFVVHIMRLLKISKERAVALIVFLFLLSFIGVRLFFDTSKWGVYLIEAFSSLGMANKWYLFFLKPLFDQHLSTKQLK